LSKKSYQFTKITVDELLMIILTVHPQ